MSQEWHTLQGNVPLMVKINKEWLEAISLFFSFYFFDRREKIKRVKKMTHICLQGDKS